MLLDFPPDSYGARYLATLQGMSRENLLLLQEQLDSQLTEDIGEECKRMVALQCVTEALKDEIQHAQTVP